MLSTCNRGINDFTVLIISNISVVTPTSDRLVFQTNPADGRRNLYVLGLPFALTKYVPYLATELF